MRQRPEQERQEQHPTTDWTDDSDQNGFVPRAFRHHRSRLPFECVSPAGCSIRSDPGHPSDPFQQLLLLPAIVVRISTMSHGRTNSVPRPSLHIEHGTPPAPGTDQPLALPRVAEPERSSADRAAGRLHATPRTQRQLTRGVRCAHRLELARIVLRSAISGFAAHSDGSLSRISSGIGIVFFAS